MKLIPKRKLFPELTEPSTSQYTTEIQQLVTNLYETTSNFSSTLSYITNLVQNTIQQQLIALATVAQTSVGTLFDVAVSPYSLSQSIFGQKIVYIKAVAASAALTTGDGKAYFTVPDELNGMDLVDADAAVYTASSSGNPAIAIYNVTDSHDMLSTSITIDATELTSYTATTAPVINGSYDEVATGDQIRVDVDGAGTGAKGLDVRLTFRI